MRTGTSNNGKRAERIAHPFPPVADARSRILILGTMPSIQSRRQGFYYGHPQNRFWKILARLFADRVPDDPEGRRRYLLDRNIALWDVLASCTIQGSEDASIQDPQPNAIKDLLDQYPIRCIYTNGKTAARLYDQYCLPTTGLACIALPSTSPANVRFSLDALLSAWSAVLTALAENGQVNG